MANFYVTITPVDALSTSTYSIYFDEVKPSNLMLSSVPLSTLSGGLLVYFTGSAASAVSVLVKNEDPDCCCAVQSYVLPTPSPTTSPTPNPTTSSPTTAAPTTAAPTTAAPTTPHPTTSAPTTAAPTTPTPTATYTQIFNNLQQTAGSGICTQLGSIGNVYLDATDYAIYTTNGGYLWDPVNGTPKVSVLRNISGAPLAGTVYFVDAALVTALANYTTGKITGGNLSLPPQC